MIRAMLHEQKDMTITNIYTSNIKAPKYIKVALIDLMGETDRNEIIVENFNPLLSIWYGPFREDTSWT